MLLEEASQTRDCTLLVIYTLASSPLPSPFAFVPLQGLQYPICGTRDSVRVHASVEVLPTGLQYKYSS
jgi:hypothetical protein